MYCTKKLSEVWVRGVPVSMHWTLYMPLCSVPLTLAYAGAGWSEYTHDCIVILEHFRRGTPERDSGKMRVRIMLFSKETITNTPIPNRACFPVQSRCTRCLRNSKIGNESAQKHQCTIFILVSASPAFRLLTQEGEPQAP